MWETIDVQDSDCYSAITIREDHGRWQPQAKIQGIMERMLKTTGHQEVPDGFFHVSRCVSPFDSVCCVLILPFGGGFGILKVAFAG